MSALKSLQYAVLSGNKFDELPKLLCGLPLKELYVSCNALTTLPDAIADMHPTLCVLDAAANQLAKLPDAICQLANLKELEVGHNHLKKLPAELGSLKQLMNLDLSDNPGLKLDASLLTSLKSVTQLKLAYCEIEQFPLVSRLPPELALLSLEGNKLSHADLPSAVQQRTELSKHSSAQARHYFDVSWSEMRGMRPSQEDTIVIHTNAIENVSEWRALRENKIKAKSAPRDMGVVAVFDGHRGR